MARTEITRTSSDRDLIAYIHESTAAEQAVAAEIVRITGKSRYAVQQILKMATDPQYLAAVESQATTDRSDRARREAKRAREVAAMMAQQRPRRRITDDDPSCYGHELLGHEGELWPR